mgnify:CR=1 FL=1
MNPNNVIHRRRAARSKVKEAGRKIGAAEAVSFEPETGGDPKPLPEPVVEKKRGSSKK